MIGFPKFSCSSTLEQWCHSDLDSDAFCCVCGSSNNDEINYLLECSQCSIKVCGNPEHAQLELEYNPSSFVITW